MRFLPKLKKKGTSFNVPRVLINFSVCLNVRCRKWRENEEFPCDVR